MVFSVAANTLLISFFGTMGAALGVVMSYAFMAMLYMVVSYKLWAWHLDWRKLASVASLTVGFVLGTYMLPTAPFFLSVLMSATYVAAFLAVLLLMRIVLPDELRQVLVPVSEHLNRLEWSRKGD